eukprot:Gregarina_sp_Poly_1__7482@NODE_416_length_8734_cov_134_157609_g338_i0_p3_GENE_NODE_416_length_8734_cov_134_157609_g338_i0NODE_416_length_8734_cov_134_157609_g338_i0_p3_ORF_typecomplete_len451_score42_96Glyco_trans_1_4/PF13692_6/1_8e03Glyco_trans_1_4/PF13692_6/1_2e14Glycos_transf_1/PF00534_20/3_5e03Glycos_transf_1/PF00534_20/8_4e13Glyco_trans_4_4/PF13579_6/7_6e06Glyco_transf_4/PF13439_6/0_00045Glyco_transf_4/PF13439_6/5_1e02_NODE_416_length_8734_cov_134_157609_g338_i055636915
MSFALVLGLFVGLFYAVYYRIRDLWEEHPDGVVCVIVCGDIGRSPRICNHIRQLSEKINASALKNVRWIHVIGYTETPLPESIANDKNIDVTALRLVRRPMQCTRTRRLFLAFVKLQVELLSIWFTLARLRSLKVVIAQNPPATPHTILMAVVCWIRHARLILDVHNYGFTIAQMNQQLRCLTWPLKTLEQIGFRLSHERLVVSRAMQEDLQQRLNLDSTVVYDLPTKLFAPVSEAIRKSLFAQYGIDDEETKWADAPVVISSTSYTEDEDLQMLLDAVEDYAKAKNSNHELPRIRLIITGTGPNRERVAESIKARQTTLEDRVRIYQIFTTPEDYPRIMGCADLGVSLHFSSSKLDIPMKVVDMLAACLPVLSFRYPAMNEVLPRECCELSFKSRDGLCTSLIQTVKNFPNNSKLPALKQSCLLLRKVSWEDQWDSQVLPLLHLTKKTA